MTLTAYKFLTFIALLLGIHSHYSGSVIESATSAAMAAVIILHMLWKAPENVHTYSKPERDEISNN